MFRFPGKNKNRILRSLSCALLCAVLALTAVLSPSAGTYYEAASADSEEGADYTASEGTYADNELIIVYNDEALDTEDEVLEDAGVVSQDEILSSDSSDSGAVVLAELEDGVSVEEAIEELEDDSSIDYVQPNYSYSLLTTEVSDPYADEDSDSCQYYLYSSSFTEAWDYSKTEGSVTVAVIDTGCNLEHEDLAGNIDTVHAYDVTTDTLLAESDVDNNGDAIGHGTYVCGIIAAVADNSLGIAGASYNANVLPVKVFDDDENSTTADIIEAYEYLSGLIESEELTDLKVINMSLGYYSSGKSGEDTALRSTIASMLSDYGVLTVCAGGNGSSSGKAVTAYCYPADFDECVSVTAVDASGANALFSDYNDAKDISAYGVGIVTTSASGGYASISGTSAAAPQVSAAAALIWAANSSLAASDVIDIIQGTADEVTGNKHSSSGSAGILDAGEAVYTSLTYESTAAEDANSWRFSDGELLEDPLTDSAISQLSSVYSTWKKSYGTSYYGIVTGSGTTKVSVSNVARVGIDVSKWQGEIDWEEVASDGISFAIIRAGGYKETSGYYDDPYFIQNIQGAIENGIEVGVYIYSKAVKTTGSTYSAAAEAKNVLSLLEEAGVQAADVDLPIFLDMEDDDLAALSAETLGDIAETFCDTIEAAGYSVGIYANKNWWTNYLTDERFTSEGWYKWVARYSVSTSTTTAGVTDTDIWQFSSNGTVSGISGSVDMNFDMRGSGYYENDVPGKVTGLSAALSDSLTSCTLTWDQVDDADGYRIYRKTSDGSYERIAEITDNGTVTYTDEGLSLGTTYVYRIRAFTEDDEGTKVFGNYSSTVSVTTTPDTVSITSVKASSSLTSAAVKWEKVSNASGYEIYRKTGSGSYSLVKTITSGTTTSWTNSSLSLGKKYTYKIRAYQTDAEGNIVYGAYSSTLSVTTNPSKVTISSASVTTSGGIQVKWKKTSNAAGYVIYRSVNGGSYKKVKTIKGNTTLKWTDTSVSAGRVYRYKIKSYQTSGSTTVYSTSYSSVKKVTAKPAKVTISSVTSTKSRSGTVKWKKVSGATGYQVAYRIKGTSKWYYTTVTTNKKVFTQLRNKNYYVKVRAYKKYNGKKYYGSWSTIKTMKVK